MDTDYPDEIEKENAFHWAAGYGYMERRGKGILRMLKLCEQNSIKCELSLTPDNNEFVVTYSSA